MSEAKALILKEMSNELIREALDSITTRHYWRGKTDSIELRKFCHAVRTLDAQSVLDFLLSEIDTLAEEKADERT